MSSLTRDQILAKRFDLPREPVESELLGGTVYVRVLSLHELVKLQADEAGLKEQGREHEGLALVTVASACDADGRALFDGSDVGALCGLPLAALSAIADAALKLNKLDGGAFEAGRKN